MILLTACFNSQLLLFCCLCILRAVIFIGVVIGALIGIACIVGVVVVVKLRRFDYTCLFIGL